MGTGFPYNFFFRGEYFLRRDFSCCHRVLMYLLSKSLCILLTGCCLGLARILHFRNIKLGMKSVPVWLMPLHISTHWKRLFLTA